MKIVFCLNYFMPEHTGGTEVYTWALGKSLQEKGNQVTIVIPGYEQATDDEYHYDRLRVIRYAEPNQFYGTQFQRKKAPSGLAAFQKVIREIAPDVIHVQEFSETSGIGIFHLRFLRSVPAQLYLTMHIAKFTCFRRTLLLHGQEICDGLIDINRCTSCVLDSKSLPGFAQKVLYHIALPLYRLDLNPGRINHMAAKALSVPFIINDIRDTLLEIVNLCDKVILVAEWYQEILLKNGVKAEQLKYIKQALPYAVHKGLEKSVLPKNPLKLIFIGRFHEQKGLHLLIAALKNLTDFEIDLDIYGSANDSAYYENLKRITSAMPNVSWKGYLAQQDVVGTMAKYHALVLASATEMSPLVIQEAFAAGIPVIGSDILGIAERVKHGFNGLLFEFNSSDALKDTLLTILTRPEVLVELRQNIAAPDDFENVAREHLDLYSSGFKAILPIFV